MRIISADTETTGVDVSHGAKPYIVTTCDQQCRNVTWEWDVDPITREPVVPDGDIAEVQNYLIFVFHLRF